MRPVNLIPHEERRGERMPLRTGPVPYVIIGVLALVLIGVTVLVLTGNKIADSKSEVASLKSQVAAAKAEAAQLSAYTDFASMQQARDQTVASLAASRFDWKRVLNELAIVIPGDVWLTNVSATASPDSATGSSTSITGAESITGPSLDIQGCSRGHEGVAKFLAALHDVDGVTRVSVISSDRPGASGSTASGASASSGDGAGSISCSTYDFISTFEVVLAFDGAGGAASATVPSTSDAPTAQPASDGSQAGGGDTQAQQGDGTATAVVSGTGTSP